MARLWMRIGVRTIGRGSKKCRFLYKAGFFIWKRGSDNQDDGGWDFFLKIGFKT